MELGLNSLDWEWAEVEGPLMGLYGNHLINSVNLFSLLYRAEAESQEEKKYLSPSPTDT